MAITLHPARPEDREAILAISAQIWEGEDYIPNVLDDWITDGGFAVALPFGAGAQGCAVGVHPRLRAGVSGRVGEVEGE